MRTNDLTLACQTLTSIQLENVIGAGADLGPEALGEAAQMGVEGSIKALGQSDAPSIKNGINSFNQNFNPVYKGLDAARSYFNPQPGHGAAGDTYVPATSNANGSINSGRFLAPK